MVRNVAVNRKKTPGPVVLRQMLPSDGMVMAELLENVNVILKQLQILQKKH